MDTSRTEPNFEDIQKIEFMGTEDTDFVEICANNVTILPSPGDHNTGSSKVKLKNIVDYLWEERFYSGQLLAVHMGGEYVAYGINATTPGGGKVRVLNRQTQARVLIKGIDGMIDDIAFAHTTQQVMLACVDKSGNLYVHLIKEIKATGLTCVRLLWVEPDEDSRTGIPSLCYRVIWCPYIPDGDTEISEYDIVAHLLAVTRGNKIELWNVGMVANKPRTGPIRPGEVEEGFIEINEHSQMIVDAAFSPDGTAIATASMDGEVKFFQVYMMASCKARCLHEWKPHDGKPLSALFFLDNHKNFNPEVQFWKYVITGCNSNSELKLWACQTWECVQTIRFLPRPDTNFRVQLKAAIDRSSDYLLLSNMKQRVLYVLQIEKDAAQTSCFIRSVSEFPLPYPILSFGILDAGVRRFKCSSSFTLEDQCNGDGDEEDENERVNQLAVMIRMFLVQPKSLQECNILFQSRPQPLTDVNSGSQNSLGISESYNDELNEQNCVDTEPVPVPLPVVSPIPVELPMNHNPIQLNLMTPDAFNSPTKHSSPTQMSGTLPAENTVNIESSSFHGSASKLSNPSSPLQKPVAPCGGAVAFASGGSSPSREVQEIFSLQGPQSYYPETEILHVNNIEGEAKAEEPEWPMTSTIATMMAETHAINSEENDNSDRNNPQIHRLSLDNSDLKNIENSLAAIQRTMAKQQDEIKSLKEEVLRLNNPREFEKVISRKLNQQGAMLEKSLDSLCTKEDNRKNQESSISTISQAIDNIVSSKLDDIVASEINNGILPVIIDTMESLKHQLHIDMTQKLSATDHLLKENINKLVNSKSVMDALSNSLSHALTPVLTQTLRDHFMNVALPNHEKACALMFSQINDSFSKGTKEYLMALENHAKKLSEKGRDSALQMQESAEQIKTSAHQISTDLNKATTRIEFVIGEAMRAQQSALEQTVLTAVRSGAVTPAPHNNDLHLLHQQQITAYLNSGNIKSAFQTALSVGDLSLVMMVCEKINPHAMFNTRPCPLNQNILLSLIQQLSSDLNTHTELKRKYLEESLVHLDFSCEPSKEHAPSVLFELQKKLSIYIKNNEASDVAHRFKILQLAVKAAVDQCR